MRRLTYFERQIIESGMRVGKAVRAVARCLGRDHRVIQREVDRNTCGGRMYEARIAERLAEKREKKRHIPKLERSENEILREFVIEKLKEDLSLQIWLFGIQVWLFGIQGIARKALSGRLRAR
ncbi:MAG TPA: hypothetical protein DCY48_02130 [Candidatus Magasanikbacteria bacterium]|nr:MAG: hypothetical protein A3I74_01040 [Candidatus Magasanikbacteria bacterium RIFCSPLOWO2_02_FULL_47_16]OGH79970.1 MAG: hypothetical protein A3C10_02185 [Candidatus Magasanikbacteria bacterium RIFCSPHIGHO2_02_FULL_48_18]OGH82982.1 MAG: hypothetical protein A3G08_03670 [Candidatus Magasanikbacteria bacterium RIFCSPLOWO2_12_FULL_47_9b]HAZ28554.1 hypothetical protein [Candidatus Magasanikbacteria bacterium]